VRRLHKELKEVLDEYSQNIEMKCKLLTGRRVTLVEELSEFCKLYKVWNMYFYELFFL